MLIYHASKVIVEYPIIKKTKYTKDFSWGFYCTRNIEQARRWAVRGTGEGIINKYEYTENPELNILYFKDLTDDWLDFIAHCRLGGLHDYDIVEGPMANDTVWNYVNDYMQGIISREQFWALARFKYPTNQLSFHTLKALGSISYAGNEVACE
ncbi:MAG: DUF3990 domain-containing protein [Lachnospiraceae bacterium]|nr:DUF3990 domain-containing protein [Lachnospiraceae bacterium]